MSCPCIECNIEHPPAETPAMNPAYITVTHGMRGWFAVFVCWTVEDGGGFYEPWTTHPVSHATRDAALAEAQSWARSEGVEFKP